MDKINTKKNIIHQLDNLDDSYLNLTVAEFRIRLLGEIKVTSEESTKNNLKFLKRFKNVYLKYNTNGLLGKELKVLHVKRIQNNGYDVEYNKVYQLIGEKISFNYANTYKVEMKNDGFNVLVSEEKLISYTVITKEEYESYNRKHLKVIQSLNDITNELI